MNGDLEETVHIKWIQSGERDKLKDLLREKLGDCGWEKAMKAHCRAFSKDKILNQVKLDCLINEIAPIGRGNVPDKVRTDLLKKIKSSIEGVANPV